MNLRVRSVTGLSLSAMFVMIVVCLFGGSDEEARRAEAVGADNEELAIEDSN